MTPSRVIILVIAAILFGLAWVSGGNEVTDYVPYYAQRLIGRTATVTVQGKTLYVEVARSAGAKSKGLAGRRQLPLNHGMLFPFDTPGQYEFWMQGMEIPLDIVWLRDGVIVELSRNARPPGKAETPVRVKPTVPVNQVLEVRAGIGKDWQPGNPVTVRDDRPLFLP